MKHLSITVLLSTVLLLTGCTTYSAYKEVGKQGSALVADEALRVHLWGICTGASYGSIKRWVGTNKTMADALKYICDDARQADVETQ